MRLGLITDIHEHVEHLRGALDRFRAERVDQVVVIGDVFRQGERIDETCRLLAAAGAIGVWGNHDFGLAFEPGEVVRQRFPEEVLRFMASLKPTLELAGCHFSHVEPWLDPRDVADLWYYEGPPDRPSKLARIFNAARSRIMFAGHYHQWLLASPDAVSSWAGDVPIRLDGARQFVVVGALCEGRYATFDTRTSELVPFNEAILAE